MKKIENQLIEKIVKYRYVGYSYREISKLLNIGKGTAYNYALNVKISDEGKLRLKNIVKKKERFVKVPTTITVSLIRILGHCFFDGSVSADTVKYTNTSLDLMSEFTTDMKNVFSIDYSSLRSYKSKSVYYAVHYPYTALVRYLKKFSESFSTSSSKCIIPDFLFNSRKILIFEFLRTFWEDEGSIKVGCKSITGKTKSKTIANQLQDLHRKVSVDSTVRFDKTNNAYELYIRKNDKNLNNFIRNIGFGNSTVTRGKYKGIKKMSVFSMVFKT